MSVKLSGGPYVKDTLVVVDANGVRDWLALKLTAAGWTVNDVAGVKHAQCANNNNGSAMRCIFRQNGAMKLSLSLANTTETFVSNYDADRGSVNVTAGDTLKLIANPQAFYLISPALNVGDCHGNLWVPTHNQAIVTNCGWRSHEYVFGAAKSFHVRGYFAEYASWFVADVGVGYTDAIGIGNLAIQNPLSNFGTSRSRWADGSYTLTDPYVTFSVNGSRDGVSYYIGQMYDALLLSADVAEGTEFVFNGNTYHVWSTITPLCRLALVVA